MSATIKLLSSKKELASYNISKGESIVFDGQSKINYQLVDNATGKAPEKIIAKRDGNDLQITLNTESSSPDIIIKNYYEGDNPEQANSNSMIIGEAANGKIYAYVPESDETQDAVAMLDNQESATQILGEEELDSNGFWVYMPWWVLGLGLLGGGIALAVNNGSKKDGTDSESAPQSGNANTVGGLGTTDDINLVQETTPDAPELVAEINGSITARVPRSIAENVKSVEVYYTDENNVAKTVTATKNTEGKWSINHPTDNANVLIDEDTGVINLVAEEVKDGSEVRAKAVDNSGNSTSEEDIEAAKVIANDNPSGIKFSDDGSRIIGKTEPEAVVVVKDTDGNVLSGDVADGSGKFTLPLNPALTNGEDVKVIIDSGEGNVKEIDLTAPDLTAPAAPNLVAEVDGSISVTPPMDNDVKSVQVNYTDENGTEKTLVASKDDEGKWSITEPTDTVATINETSGVISIPATEVKDGSEVIAKATDNSGNTTSDENAAKVIANENNSTGVKFSDDGASIIGKTAPESVVVVKDENNIIISEGISDGEGRFTLPLNPALTNGENVKVIIDSGESGVKEIDLTAPDLTAPAAPDLVAEVDGSISVTPPTDNDVKSVQVNYTDENGTEKTLVATKNDEGKWSITEPTGTVATINETSGVISIPATEVKDGSEVIAKATDNSGNTTSDENAAKVIANENNSTGIKFSDDGASIIGKTEPEAVVVVKDENNIIISEGISDGEGRFTLPLNPALTNGEDVKVIIDSGEDNVKEIDLTAPDLTAPAAPNLVAEVDGSISVTPPTDM
ncbi:Ig-like domain-containing protein [Volucribacter amazonae]|uniref:Bacterial Ig domain-containing protein n=1 Tax=Volucribacter amazonae TaxID=256731 RepID=A0A9X4PEP6_9PAST|nr:Ig-like domain-containing protein [Volucribacter amazonae]MDG6896031.1 hypothetical protein [Volucribacter amazonae]